MLIFPFRGDSIDRTTGRFAVALTGILLPRHYKLYSRGSLWWICLLLWLMDLSLQIFEFFQLFKRNAKSNDSRLIWASFQRQGQGCLLESVEGDSTSDYLSTWRIDRDCEVYLWSDPLYVCFIVFFCRHCVGTIELECCLVVDLTDSIGDWVHFAHIMVELTFITKTVLFLNWKESCPGNLTLSLTCSMRTVTWTECNSI